MCIGLLQFRVLEYRKFVGFGFFVVKLDVISSIRLNRKQTRAKQGIIHAFVHGHFLCLTVRRHDHQVDMGGDFISKPGRDDHGITFFYRIISRFHF